MADWPTLRIGFLYPEWMSLYGDRGNVMVLAQRARWRGIPVEVRMIGADDAADLAAMDLLLLGGGSDDAQAAISADLKTRRADALHQAAAAGVVILAVCGGYQLLGHYYRTNAGEALPGVGLLDIWTEAGSPRLVGDVVIETQPPALPPMELVGYENHAGRTYLGPRARPLGRVRFGCGNNGRDGGEGAVQGSVFGTYLHGPLLPKNPAFADHLLQLALRRHGISASLPPLDDTLEELAHASAVARAAQRRRAHAR
ncbi:MAG TPA: glutamine amidotransferase [Limnochordia bacterium]